jgi:hypothetical protein
MYPTMKTMLIMVVLCSATVSVHAQLRMHSPYDYDRINTTGTWFLLHETGKAEFTWASEWTQQTAYAFSDLSAIFVWHFKEGMKAYSRQGEFVGDFGRLTRYDLKQNQSELVDMNHHEIQPMNRNNFPVKLELWIGEVSETSGFDPQMLVHQVCFDASGIEYGRQYQFNDCPVETGEW